MKLFALLKHHKKTVDKIFFIAFCSVCVLMISAALFWIKKKEKRKSVNEV